MKALQATALRKNLYRELEKVASSRTPVEILRRGKPLAVLVPSAEGPVGSRKPLIDLDAVSAFCKEHAVKGFYLFGSILTDAFEKDSDVDVMVDLAGRQLGFHEMCDMLDHLETMFGRKVDMLTKDAVHSRQMNRHRKAAILSSAKLIYDVTI